MDSVVRRDGVLRFQISDLRLWSDFEIDNLRFEDRLLGSDPVCYTSYITTMLPPNLDKAIRKRARDIAAAFDGDGINEIHLLARPEFVARLSRTVS